MEFHDTMMGDRFYNHTMPRIADELSLLNENIATNNRLLAKAQKKDNDATSKERLEELLINAFEWAIECSETITHDIIRATGITSDELEQIGYDKENFRSMHKWAEEE